MPKSLTVVVSQGQSKHPARRGLEEDIVAGLLGEAALEVTIVSHLYDLDPDGTGILCLQGIPGDMVVLAWLYPRAARWTLDRHDVHGKEGTSLLDDLGSDDSPDEELEDAELEDDEDKQRVTDQRHMPDRTIWCLDLNGNQSADVYIEEVKRIAGETHAQVVPLTDWIQSKPTHVDEQAGRRWYPVIDFSRCTNCMECIDFCLFGVYGVDQIDTILVEQPDNCRKGCPACSRVCPENAIIFPQHKTPAIAGSPEAIGTLKIDLSKLFGQPNDDSLNVAVRERDEQLMMAGRDAVGTGVGIPRRQQGKETRPKDELDNLIDQLDELDI